MLSKIIKYLGLVLIISFCAASVLFSIMQRDIEDPRIRSKLSYASFFEDRFYDFRMKQSLNKKQEDKRLILVAIDDKSIKHVGKWPFPRTVYTTLMNQLKSFGTKVIAYDVFFSEESLACPGDFTDQKMAEAIIDFQTIPGNKVILPYSLTSDPSSSFQEMPDVMYNFILDTKQAQGVNLQALYMESSNFPIPLFNETDASIAHIEAESDIDGIFRHYPLVGNVETLYFPSFALSIYQNYTGDSGLLEILSEGLSILKLQSGSIDLNYKGETKVRWIGGQNSFPGISLSDVLIASPDDPRMKEIFNNNIVFIGSTAYGAHDLRHTPIDNQMPGVYFHMNMVNMLLEGRFFKPYEESTKISWIILIAGTLLILFIQFFENPLLDLFSVVAITGGFYFLDTYYLLPMGYEIKLFFCLLSVFLCYSWNTFLHFYLANKDKKFLKEAFGSYISPELIDQMYSQGEPPKLGGDSGIRTAYFTDIQSFSTFSEKLSATKLVELLNEYLSVMTDILLEEQGTLDKYEGDAIIAFFGAPMPLEDHAVRACMTAHRMQEALGELRAKWTSEGDKWPQIVHEMRMRIGINSGEIVTGNMGSKLRMNYTMMGDAVNLAARLEESAKQYGIFTQVTKETVEMTGDLFLWRELDKVRVVGKSVPVISYELLGLKETAPDYLKELSEKFAKALELYKSQQFQEALSLFKETLDLEYKRLPELKGKKTNPSEIYIERCEAYIANPPEEDWDGVWTLTAK